MVGRPQQGREVALSPPDRALYDLAGIEYEKLRPWQQGDVDYNEVRKRRRSGSIEGLAAVVHARRTDITPNGAD